MRDVNIEVSLVINRCYGGFTLSHEASRELARRKGITLVESGEHLVVDGTGNSIDELVGRDDADLIEIVRAMGKAASGLCSQLEVVTLPITVEIDRHDGKEQLSVFGGAY